MQTPFGIVVNFSIKRVFGKINEVVINVSASYNVGLPAGESGFKIVECEFKII